jgi:hypothetical protein
MKPISTLDDDEFSRLLKAAVDMPDAPPALVRAAASLWPSRESSTPNTTNHALLNRVLAVLSFDSWAVSTASLGLRAVQSNQSRQLIFTAPGRDIDVRIVSSNDSYVLAGQILGPDESGAVELSVNTESQSARVIHKSNIDDLSSFHIDNLRAGTYWMTLTLSSGEIELPPIQVGAGH